MVALRALRFHRTVNGTRTSRRASSSAIRAWSVSSSAAPFLRSSAICACDDRVGRPGQLALRDVALERQAA